MANIHLKISRNYIILYILLLGLTSSFVVFILQFEFSDPNFPFWITGFSILLFILASGSFIWNYKTLHVLDKEIQIKRLFRSDLIIPFSQILNIEEFDFRYRGSHYFQTVYKGYFLDIKTVRKNVKTTSLNEPEYEKLRERLKEKIGERVSLQNKFKGHKISWFYLSVILIPTFYLLVQIFKKL